VGLTVTGNNGDMSSITREITVQQSEPPIMRWNKTFGGDGDDRVYSLMHTSDGGYILAGYSYCIDERHFDARLVKTDANGNMQWQRNIKGNDSIEAHSAMQTSDDGYIIAGSTGIYYGIYDFWLVKIDAEGTEQWNRTFGGDSSNQLYSLQQTFDGGYILGGDTRSFGTGSSDFWLVKIDNNGIELWNRTFGGANHESAHSVQQTPDGGFIMAGVTRSLHSNDCWLVKTDTEGVEMWSRTIVGPNEDNSPYSILQSPDGGYIIVGKTGSVSYGSYDMWLVRTDPDGYVQWEMTLDGTGQGDVAMSVLLAPDGGLVVAGDKDWFTEQGTDFWLIKLGGIPAEPEDGGALTDGEPAIPVMAVNAYKRRFGISFLRKYYLILRTSTRHITRKINYERLHYSRGLGLKQNKRPGIADGEPVQTQDAPTDGEPVHAQDIPGFGAAVAVMGLLVCVGLARWRR